jgi:hypothetical protein
MTWKEDKKGPYVRWACHRTGRMKTETQEIDCSRQHRLVRTDGWTTQSDQLRTAREKSLK